MQEKGFFEFDSQFLQKKFEVKIMKKFNTFISFIFAILFLSSILINIYAFVPQVKNFINEKFKIETEVKESSSLKDSEKISPIFNENSVEIISKVSDEISAKNMTTEEIKETYGWSVGDKITIEIDNEDYSFIILDFNTDEKSDGSGKAGITLGMDSVINNSDGFIYSSSSIYSWGSDLCEIWKETMNTYLKKLPSDWQSKIKSVKKITSGVYSNFHNMTVRNELITTNDFLWLLSVGEIYSETSFTTDNEKLLKDECHQYEYFKTLIGDSSLNDSNENLKVLSGNDSYSWWLRSSYFKSPNTYIYSIDNSGKLVFNDNHSSHFNLKFCFCI